MPSGQRQLLFDLAAGLPGARILDRAADQLGRAGVGISRVERDLREELVFDPGTHELLGYQQVLVNPDAEYAAPGGAITGWTAYVSRQLRTALPERIPPLPGRHAIRQAAGGEPRSDRDCCSAPGTSPT